LHYRVQWPWHADTVKKIAREHFGHGAWRSVETPLFLVITLNGSRIPARFQGAGAKCPNDCTSTMVLDPVAYATPGPDYNSVGLVGPQPNPFWFDPTQVAATIDHYGQWGTTTSQTGAFVFGSFTAPINHRGVITGYGWQ
jgi:hypothetical protein